MKFFQANNRYSHLNSRQVGLNAPSRESVYQVEKIAEFETIFLDLMRTSYRETVLQPLAEGCLNDDITGTIEKVAKEVCDSLML